MLPFLEFPSIDSIYRKADELATHNVVVTEKLHGSNFRFRVFKKDGVPTIEFGSRNREITLEMAKKNFYAGRPVLKILKLFNEGKFDWLMEVTTTFYGEWCGDGVIGGTKYGPADFYCFAITLDNEPIRRFLLEILCEAIGLKTAPLIAKGIFPVEQIVKMIDVPSKVAVKENTKTEGIVVMIDPPNDITNLTHGYTLDKWLIVKHKNEKFAEVTVPKPISSHHKFGQALAIQLSEKYVTEGRINNILSHCDFVPNYDITDMKYLSLLVPADIKKEGKEDWDKAIKNGSNTKQLYLAINTATAKLYKKMFTKKFQEENGTE